MLQVSLYVTNQSLLQNSGSDSSKPDHDLNLTLTIIIMLTLTLTRLKKDDTGVNSLLALLTCLTGEG